MFAFVEAGAGWSVSCVCGLRDCRSVVSRKGCGDRGTTLRSGYMRVSLVVSVLCVVPVFVVGCVCLCECLQVPGMGVGC